MDNKLSERRRSRSVNFNKSAKKDSMKNLTPDRTHPNVSKLKKISESKLPSNIQVHVRVRPLLSSEVIKSNKKSVNIVNQKQIFCGNDREFNFDLIYNEKSSQQMIFENSVKSNLEKSLEGYNMSTFAYGQTAAGKTYTIGTNYSKTSEVEKGIIQISIDYLFNRVKEIAKENNCEFIIKASFIEIYNEEIRDLLNLKTPSKNIILRDINSSVAILGITETPVLDADDTRNLIWAGSLNRKTASTYSNDVSSRSHAIFILNIEKISNTQTMNFKINFIDLAGSERIKKSGATGERFKETVSINSGLLSLSKVIMALSEESRKLANNPSANVHIPYRESKLTRILKDSLGGNSITVMLACISPSSLNYEETVSTLNYASFAKSIKIMPMVNTHIASSDYDEVVDRLKKENEDMKRELDKYKNSLVEAENFKLKGIIKILRQKLNSSNDNVNALNQSQAENVFSEIDEKEKNDDHDLDLNDFNHLIDNQNNIELEYSNKIKENMRLKEENEFLNNEIQNFKEIEDEYKRKLGVAANMIGQKEDSKLDSSSFQEYFEDNNPKCKIPKPNKNENNANDNDYSVCDNSENDISMNCQLRTSQSLVVLRQKSSSSINGNENKKDPQFALICDKIKLLKEFQFSLKQKILDNETFKNKLVRNKNEEITYFKRDALEKNKQLKNLSKVNERKNELLENSENTINVLKEELRNKSIELKKMKGNKNQIPLPLSNSETKPKSRKTSIKDESLYNTNNNNSVIINDHNKLKNNYASGCSLKSGVNNYVHTISFGEEPKDFYFTMKNLMKTIEDFIIQKHKLEKRLKYLQKEKIEFLNLIKVSEDRISTKLSSLNKQKSSLESILKAIDENNKDKINYSNKYQATVNKVNGLNGRLEKTISIRENTLKDITSNEDILKDQIADIESNIIEIKHKISNDRTNQEDKNIIDIESLVEQKEKSERMTEEKEKNLYYVELRSLVKEKDEKLVFIELDNMYKEKKILDLEKNLKETILQYEEKIFVLQFDLKNLSNNNSNSLEEEHIKFNFNNTIESKSTIDKSEYNTLVKKKLPINPKSVYNKTNARNIIPPCKPIIKTKTLDATTEKSIMIESAINELTTLRRPETRQPINIPNKLARSTISPKKRAYI